MNNINREDAKKDLLSAFPGLTKSKSCGTCRFWEWEYEGAGKCNHSALGKIREKYDFDNIEDLGDKEWNICYETMEMAERQSTDLCDHFVDNGETGPNIEDWS